MPSDAITKLRTDSEPSKLTLSEMMADPQTDEVVIRMDYLAAAENNESRVVWFSETDEFPFSFNRKKAKVFKLDDATKFIKILEEAASEKDALKDAKYSFTTEPL